MEWLNLNFIAREFVAWMADASLRAVVLAMLALLLVPFLRRSSTAQHTLWTLVLAGMLALPFLRPVVPATHVRLPQALTPRPAAIPHGRLTAVPYRTASSISALRARNIYLPLWPLFLFGVYLAGVALFGARLLVGVWWTRRALRNTRTIHSELWEYYELIADANVDLNLEESDCVRVPLTTGSQLLRVIFPADWREWPEAKRKAILAHELAHARRRDPLIALLAAVIKCVFWFHPLAWWLERRLAVLAEHAADDAALAVSFDIQAYARLLLESAAQLDNGGNRLIWNSVAMSGPVVAERIRRVLNIRTVERLKPLGIVGRAVLLCLGAMLIWTTTAVDVPRLTAGQTDPMRITSEDVASMEQKLAVDPEDETTRGALIRYYLFHRMEDRRIPLVLWLIDHHPESDQHDLDFIMPPPVDSPNVYQDARNRWLAQVNLHPNDARVLVNAALAFRIGRDSLQEQIDLLQRARTLDPKRATEPLARIYSVILVSVNEPGLAAQVRDELQSSNDIALVGSVARHVVEEATGRVVSRASTSDSYSIRILATELVSHAQALEPQNRDWSDLMEGVNELPDGSVPPVAQKAPASVPTIHVGGKVAAMNLEQSSPPIYPPDAKAAGIHVEGTVKLQIRIGADGHVKEATVISGNQILANAAMDAALGYVYKPTMLNGQPVEVLTDVEIVFPGT
jgi:beta-lactamase regulating signal transducer with metallopeptidase domain